MKNRKGFSLIELLGVLIIIGLILLVVLPIVSRLLTSNEKKQYMQYLDVIKKGAIKYADTLKDELGGYNNIACNEIDIVDDLIAEKFIKEYNDKKIECTGKVRLNNDFGNLKVSINLTCKNKNTGEETFKINEINSGDSCIAYDPEAKYTIVYDANGGTGEMGNTICTYGSKCSLSKNLYTMENWKFLGWSTSPNGEVIYYDDTTVINVAESGETITLYAKWDADTYTIKYVANNGTEIYTTQNCVVGSDCTLKENNFTRNHYAFAGWSTTADGNKIYDNKEKINGGLGAKDEIIILYAVWDLKIYTINYNPNYPDKRVYLVSSSSQCNIGGSCTLKKYDFTNDFYYDYNFVGWSTTKNGSNNYNGGENVGDISNNQETITLYGVWNVKLCNSTNGSLINGVCAVSASGKGWVNSKDNYGENVCTCVMEGLVTNSEAYNSCTAGCEFTSVNLSECIAACSSSAVEWGCVEESCSPEYIDTTYTYYCADGWDEVSGTSGETLMCTPK